MNGLDILLLLVIGAALALAVGTLRSRRKKGRGCCGDCGGCSAACERKEREKP